MLDRVALLYQKAGHPGIRNQRLTDAKRRYIAYRQFTVWIYGKCDYKQRRHTPQCVTKKIRTVFPSGNYVGFGKAADSNESQQEADDDDQL